MRPRHKPIEITAQKQLERLNERFSRRELLQMLGAGGAAGLAGCGGGGQQATESPTETPAGGQQTATETPTETPTESPTPTQGVTVTDQRLREITTQNLEKIQPNAWNTERGGVPVFQQFDLSVSPATMKVAPLDDPLSVVFPMSAKKISLHRKNSEITLTLREDIQWGDGSDLDAENVQMHADIMKAQVSLGEASETTLPVSMESTGEYSLRMKLLPGNPVLRAMTAFFQGNLKNVSITHPKLHKKFVEQIRSATTTNATKSALQKLFKATFPKSDLPKMALGPFKATEWNPSRVLFDAREDWPWGLDYHEVDRVFKGIRWKSVGEKTQAVNAAVAGEKDWVTLPVGAARKRFDKNKWTIFRDDDTSSTGILFSPKSDFGKKTETARHLRKGVAYVFDNKEFAAINDLKPAYEQTTGFSIKVDFQNWIGEEFFANNFTNYGKKDTGYVFKEKGYDQFRQAGYDRNKNGTWVSSETGDPLTPTVVLPKPGGDLTRPTLNNIVEQLNDHGVKAEGKIMSGEKYNNAIGNQEFDLGIAGSQTDINPHPFFAFREDMGLGSREGLPAGIAPWDWRNGYRRVEVPFPVGSPDGELQTYDWDKNVKEMVEIESQQKMRDRIHELTWVMNQWVPAVWMKVQTVWLAVRAPDRIRIADDFKAQYYGEGRPLPLLFGGGFWQVP